MTLTEKYYAHRLDNLQVSKEEEILFALMADFTARNGLQQGWESIADEIQNEILEKWIEIVRKKLSA